MRFVIFFSFVIRLLLVAGIGDPGRSKFMASDTNVLQHTPASIGIAGPGYNLGGQDIYRCAQPALAVHFHAMHDLFAKTEAENMERISAAAPLAARMRPRTLDEFVGQKHILAPGKLLRRAIEAYRVPSLIISGPYGS